MLCISGFPRRPAREVAGAGPRHRAHHHPSPPGHQVDGELRPAADGDPGQPVLHVQRCAALSCPELHYMSSYPLTALRSIQVVHSIFIASLYSCVKIILIVVVFIVTLEVPIWATMQGSGNSNLFASTSPYLLLALFCLYLRS